MTARRRFAWKEMLVRCAHCGRLAHPRCACGPTGEEIMARRIAEMDAVARLTPEERRAKRW